MKIKLLALFFFFFSSEAFSQSEQLDSLLNSLKLEKEEDKKMKIISNVLKKAYYSKPEIFNFYLDSLHFYSKSLDEKRYIAEYFRFKGISLMRNNNLDSSKLNFKKSIATFLKADDTLNAIRTLSNLASCYNKAGDIQLAKKTYYEVLKFTGRSKKKNFLVSNQIVKYNLGVFYSKQGKNDSAINYLNKSLKIGKQLENNEMIGESLYMLATIHSSLVQGEKVDSLFKESLFYSKQTGNNTYISAIYNNWAKHLVKRKSNKQGLLLYKTGLFYAKLSKDFDLISNLY